MTAVVQPPRHREPHTPTQTHAEVTRDVLATLATPSRGYYMALFGAIAMFLVGAVTFVLLLRRAGARGLPAPGDVDGLHHQLRLLDRYRTRRHADLGDSVPVPLAVADRGLPLTEAMTVFAVMTAALFPIIHIGRQWVFYWLLPYPNQRFLWPNFKSPLLWDVFAITTYFTVSTTFLIIGLIPTWPRSATRSPGWQNKIYGMLSLGWTGANSQWRHYSGGISISPRWPRRWCCRSTRWCPGISRCRSCRDGTAPSSRLFRRRGDLLGHRDGAHPADPAPQGAQARAHADRLPLRQPRQADPAHRLDPVLRLRHGVFRLLVQRQSVRTGDLLSGGRSGHSGGPAGP